MNLFQYGTGWIVVRSAFSASYVKGNKRRSDESATKLKMKSASWKMPIVCLFARQTRKHRSVVGETTALSCGGWPETARIFRCVQHTGSKLHASSQRYFSDLFFGSCFDYLKILIIVSATACICLAPCFIMCLDLFRSFRSTLALNKTSNGHKQREAVGRSLMCGGWFLSP
jgi:hypothetical protein